MAKKKDKAEAAESKKARNRAYEDALAEAESWLRERK